MFSYIASNDDHSHTYYVNIQSLHLHNRPDVADYHLVINANEQQKNELLEMMRSMGRRDEDSLQPMLTRPLSNDLDPVNSSYDQKMQQLFSRLYELGTEDTKQHIQSMNIL